jgi:hypothetical protein
MIIEMQVKLQYIILLIALFLALVLLTCKSSNEKPEHTLVDKSGLIGMEKFDELEYIGKVSSRRSEEIIDSRWGIQISNNIWTGEPEPLDVIDWMIQKLAESGVKWTRISFNPMARTPGFYLSADEGYFRWNELDRMIQGFAQSKINVYITINRPDISTIGDDGSGMTTEIIKDFADASAVLVKRYSNIVKHWEILNEPHITPGYIELVRAVSKSIKQVDPKAKVLAGSLARGEFGNIKYLVDNAGSSIDIITFHPYNEYPEALKYPWMVPIEDSEETRTYVRASTTLKEMRLQIGDYPIEFWQGECGYPSSEHSTGWKGRGPWNENIQAKWMLRRFLVNASLDVPVNVWYLLAEHKHTRYRNDSFGLFTVDGASAGPVSEIYRPKQGYLTMQHITSIFDEKLNSLKEVRSGFEIIDEGSFTGIRGENDKEFLNRDKPYNNEKSPNPIEVVAFTGSEGDAVTYWFPSRLQTYVKPARVNLSIEDVNISEPVLVDLLSGVVYRPEIERINNGIIFKGLPLADYPLAIVPKHLVKTE